VWNEIKSNISSALVYFREFILFLILVVLIIFLLIDNTSLSVPLIILLIVVGIIVLNLIGRRRIKEIDEIKEIISSIRLSKYESSSEIFLSKHLDALENEIKQMFEKTKNDIEYLERLQKMRSQFLANVSHELRTPIFAIQGYIETLLNGALNDPKVNKHFLGKAELHTVNLSNLLNDLIDISMIESGEMRMSYRYFDINEFIKNIVSEFSLIAEEKNVQLIFNPANIGLQEKKSVNINVIDTGIGIPQEDIDRIFERFYRVDKARSKAVGGTGLGLAIVKHIIDAHSSKIIVESVFGKGSRFSFKLKK